MKSNSGSAILDLPPRLKGLDFLATDLRFTWSYTTDYLWEKLDPDLFAITRNPWLVLLSTSSEKLQELAEDDEYCEKIAWLLRREEASRTAPRWFSERHGGGVLESIAYFSMEFGLSESLPIYSGGLGLLAGDHLKAAHDLGVPLTGVGLLYQNGYFRQAIDKDGAQIAYYPANNVSELPIIPARDKDGRRLRFELALPGRSLYLRVWQAKIGLITLLLLDTNDPANDPVDRCITTELYGHGDELRMRQEILLGIGGYRVLQALGMRPQVLHLNEGHAAFAVLERARRYMSERAVDFELALTMTRAGNLFTTHTPVEAGFDRFDPALVRQYLRGYAEGVAGRGDEGCLNITFDRLLALGRRDPNDASEPFNMAYLAVRGSNAVNAVSRLHGEVSRRIFAPLFPGWPLAQIPVGHVTNGVHVPTWDSAASDALWTKAIGKQGWMGDLEGMSERISQLPDGDVWQLRADNRAALVKYVREHHARQLRRDGAVGDEAMEQSRHLFDPNVLTLGFARRFATYKRPNLLLADPERFARILTNPQRPVQMVVAGKAHPADEPGKAMVRQMLQFMQRPDVRPHLVFVPDYNINVAEQLTQGVDVWINNPRRPFEASGTSGMKVLVNGGLNLSELDGWWAEAYEPGLGWAIGDGQEHGSDPDWDRHEAEQVYELLENEIVPSFYHRNERGVPEKWVGKVRSSMAKLTPYFSTNRMVREYVGAYYRPLAEAYEGRVARNGAVGAQVFGWRHNLKTFWNTVHIGEAQIERRDDNYLIKVSLLLGEVPPEAVRIEVYAEPEDGANAAFCTAMKREGELIGATNGFTFAATAPSGRPLSDYSIRVIPMNPNAAVPLEARQILWKNCG
ncbi:MAG: alpha-glucan family phosphorylase [Roseiarcus sp.]